MRRHPIKPRKYLRDRQERWRVHVPDDLWQPGDVRDFHFTVEKDAAAKAKEMVESRGNLAGKFFRLKQDEQAEIMRLWEKSKSDQSITVAKACSTCLSEKSLVIRNNSLIALRCAFKSMTAAFGLKRITEIEPADIKAWLLSHPDWSKKTNLNNQKYASSLFSWCKDNRLLDYNPCDGVMRPKIPHQPPGILTLPEIHRLLETCRQSDPALIGYISIILFGGFRVYESARCRPSDISSDTITLTGERTKLNLPRRIKISPQLAAWLALPGVEIGGEKLNDRMNALAKLAGVTLTKNCLRHCFCSYSYPILGVIATARAANNSEAMLAKHYLNAVTDEDAKAFAEIMPELACQDSESLVTSSPAI